MQTRGSLSLRIGLAAAVLHFVATKFDWPLIEFLTKPAPALCLVAWLLPLRSRDAAWVAVGLALSAMGDALLGGPDALFLPGLVAFLLAHVAYIGAYLGRTRALHLLRLAPVVAFMFVVHGYLAPYLGVMRVPVIAYMAVISVMIWRALAQVGELREPARAWLAAVGAVVFALSDVLVAWLRFVDPAAGLHGVLMILYWSAQAMIASSAARD